MFVVAIIAFLACLFGLAFRYLRWLALAGLLGVIIFYPLIFLPIIVLLVGAFFFICTS